MREQGEMDQDIMPGLLREYVKRKEFKEGLQEASDQYFGMADGLQSSHESSQDHTHGRNGHTTNRPAVIYVKPDAKVIWRRLKINAIAAAAIAIITAFSTLWLTGYYRNMEQSSSNYRELRRDMNTVKRDVNAQNKVLQGITPENIKNAAQNNFGATGFLISTNGYVVTNYHVVADADSIQLQNAGGHAYSASVIYTDAESDLAILKITDADFQNYKTIPYVFKEKTAELGEDVFTLGYPRDEAVYGQGYLSSMSGYSGDTSAYQISIPLNPGNSGGPLLDSKGQVIGIISGKQAGLDGTSFAIKTKTLAATISKIPDDAIEQPVGLPVKKNNLNGLPRTEQVKRIQDYVFMVKVF